MSEALKFINRFSEAVKEYRRLQRETDGSDSEIAHFMENKTKNWLDDHYDEVIALSKLNCEKPFLSFVVHYIYN